MRSTFDFLFLVFDGSNIATRNLNAQATRNAGALLFNPATNAGRAARGAARTAAGANAAPARTQRTARRDLAGIARNAQAANRTGGTAGRNQSLRDAGGLVFNPNTRAGREARRNVGR